MRPPSVPELIDRIRGLTDIGNVRLIKPTAARAAARSFTVNRPEPIRDEDNKIVGFTSDKAREMRDLHPLALAITMEIFQNADLAEAQRLVVAGVLDPVKTDHEAIELALGLLFYLSHTVDTLATEERERA